MLNIFKPVASGSTPITLNVLIYPASQLTTNLLLLLTYLQLLQIILTCTLLCSVSFFPITTIPGRIKFDHCQYKLGSSSSHSFLFRSFDINLSGFT